MLRVRCEIRAGRVDKIVNVTTKDPLKEVDYLHEYLLTVSSILYLKTYFRFKTFYGHIVVFKGVRSRDMYFV
jgi:hypothetical protein